MFHRSWSLLLLLSGLLLALLASACIFPQDSGSGHDAAVTGGPAPTPVSVPLPTGTSLPDTAFVSVLPATADPTPEPILAGAETPIRKEPISAQPVYTYTYSVVNTYPHDRSAYTQGLVYTDGVLYEGTGRLGESTLRKVALETGEVLQLRTLPPDIYGEGIALNGDEIVQLTWKSHLGFVYDRQTFELRRTFAYSTEGWGLTTDGQRLIMSDGTDTLYFLDPKTLEKVGQIQVRAGRTPLTMLNELEYIGGLVYANVWKTDHIAIIDPSTGLVTAWIDLAGLRSPEDDVEGSEDVLNGIAYDPQADRLFVTGKYWPKLFEIDLVPSP